MPKLKNILITGGSGMIGTRLTGFLLESGHVVSHLSRSRRKQGVRAFLWDPEKKQIEKGALENVDVIIHLAGAGIADKRWDQDRKKEILLSRTQSTRFLYDVLSCEKHQVSAFISASGISYYGLEEPLRPFTETDPAGQDFMAGVTAAWEKEIDKIIGTGIRVVKVRTGVVLSRDGGALKKLAMPVRFFVGAPLGSGRQVVNWIHIDDLCRLYVKAVEDQSIHGAYNAVSPHPVTNQMLTEEIAHVLKRPLWLPSVPAFMVRLIAGEVAQVVLDGGPISSDKVQRAGFEFRFATVREALKDLLSSGKQPIRIV